MVKAVFAATDEGGEGASLLIDMTKVTRSTLTDKLLPRLIIGSGSGEKSLSASRNPTMPNGH